MYMMEQNSPRSIFLYSIRCDGRNGSDGFDGKDHFESEQLLSVDSQVGG